MAAQELKQYIDRVLGSSIRCLLPSYWWKRIFHAVVDKYDAETASIASSVDSATKELESKIDYVVVSGQDSDIETNKEAYQQITSGKYIDKPLYVWYRNARSGSLRLRVDYTTERYAAIDGHRKGFVILYGVTYNPGDNDRGADHILTFWFKLYEDGQFDEINGALLYEDSAMSDTSERAVQNKVVKAYIDGGLAKKVDAVAGKQLTTEDFTTALKEKLEILNNYDDTEITAAVNGLQANLNTLVSGDVSVAIESFNEIIAFLDGIEDSENLNSIIAAVQKQIADKQEAISDLDSIRNGAALGATALQEHQDISHLATKEELAEAEEVAAAALNELNEKKADKEYVEDALKNMDTSSLASKEELEALRNEVITNEEIVASSLNDLEKRKASKEYVEDEVKNLEQYVEDALGNVSVDTSTLVTKEEFTDVEEVWAASYNLLNQKISDVQQYIYDEAASRRQFDEAIAEIQSILLENEAVVTAAWNQLNIRINALEAAQAQGE